MKRIYMDYAATTPAHPDVVKAMQPYFTKIFGNPSSIHSFGRECREAIEHSRQKVSELIGARPEEIVFTSGGTEADNNAIKGVAYANKEKGNHIITSGIEHHAVIEPCKFMEQRGFEVTYLPVDSCGLVDPEDVKKAIRNNTILVSVMHANNEIGTIQPIEEISSITAGKGILFHTDAVQTTGHIPTDLKNLPVDLLSMSAHKLYGPKGIGALYMRKGTKIRPFIHGGDQENSRRAGTENIPGIIGFAKACDIAINEMGRQEKRISVLRDKMIDGILSNIENTRLNGHRTKRLAGNVSVTVEFIEGEAMLVNLDLAGIAASAGSACSSSSLESSHVLKAVGLPAEIARSSIRFSLGRYTTEKEVNHTLKVFSGIVEKLRKMSPLYKKTK